MIITESILKEGESINGAWSKKQLLALGVEITKEFKLKKGWKKKLLGSDIPDDNVKLFLSLRNKHIKNSARNCRLLYQG